MSRTKIIRSPKTARTFNQLCSLRTDNISFPWGWVIVSEDQITIAMQKNGERATATIDISKRDFNRLIRWYEKPTAERESD